MLVGVGLGVCKNTGGWQAESQVEDVGGVRALSRCFRGVNQGKRAPTMVVPSEVAAGRSRR